MIRVGAPLLIRIACPECGELSQQLNGSDFFIICCQNSECLYRYANVVIEKRTGIVIACDAILMPDKKDILYTWKRVYPSLYDEDGKRYWPKENIDD